MNNKKKHIIRFGLLTIGLIIALNVPYGTPFALALAAYLYLSSFSIDS